MRKVVVVFGLSGSGKSYVSEILHKDFGYEWLRSDVIRKELAGISPEDKAVAGFGKGIYTEDMTRKVYEEMVKRATALLGEGRRVVLDATFLKRWQRKLVTDAFKDALFILVTADEEEIKRRLASREDVSDADYRVYLRQKEVFEPPDEVNYIKVNTQRTRDELKSVLEDLIKD